MECERGGNACCPGREHTRRPGRDRGRGRARRGWRDLHAERGRLGQPELDKRQGPAKPDGGEYHRAAGRRRGAGSAGRRRGLLYARRGQCGQPYMERQQVRYGRRKPGQYYGAGRCGWSAGYRRCAGRGRRVLRSDRERSDGRFELEREPGRNAERTRGQHTRAAGTGRRSGAGRRGRDHKRRQRAHATGGQQRGAGPIRRYADDKRQAVRVRQRDRFGRKPERGQDK